MRPPRLFAVLALLAAIDLLAAASCAPRAGSEASRAPLTERERDSLIARSNLPGGFVVGRAMTVSDRAARDAARQDSLVQQQSDSP